MLTNTLVGRRAGNWASDGCHRYCDARVHVSSALRQHGAGSRHNPLQQRSAALHAQAAANGPTAPPAPELGKTKVTDLKSFGFARDFKERYTLGKLIGSGSFGTVHKAVDKKTGQEVAVKTITKRVIGGLLESNFVRRVQHEVDIYNHLGRSLNVAFLYGAYEETATVHLVLELCTGGELWARIKRGQYSERQAARLCKGVLLTLAQCHAKGVVLRDVKPENFLFLDDSESSPLKMIDFGIADYCKPGQYLSDRAGTPLYVAPEVLKQRYTTQADVWSAGVVAYQLLAGRFPFEDEDAGLLASSLDLSKKTFTNREVFNAILYNDLDFTRPPWDHVSELGKNFVRSLLQRSPDERPTAEEALNHPWIKKWADLASDESEEGGAVAGAMSLESGGSEDGLGDMGSGDLPLSDTLVQRLQRFGTYGRLKQIGLRAIAGFVPTDSALVKQLQDAFRGLDPSGQGRVPFAQVESLLESGAFDLSPVEVRQLMSQFHIDAEGNVDYLEWLAAMIDWREVQDSQEWNAWVNKAFDMFDEDHSGKLSTGELTHLLCHDESSDGTELDECPIADTVPAVLREADEDHDGALSRAEFEALMRSPPSERLELYESRLKRRSKKKLASSAPLPAQNGDAAPGQQQ